jgi:hypothetical protein
MIQQEKELLFEKIRLNNECTIKVGGYCMTPIIRDGAEVSVAKIDMNKVKQGEILAYFIGTNLFVHRFLEKKNSSVRMCADGPNSRPHVIQPEAVLGLVKEIKLTITCI